MFWFLIVDSNSEYGIGLATKVKADSSNANITVLSTTMIESNSDVHTSRAIQDVIEVEARIIVFIGTNQEFKTAYAVARSARIADAGYAWICSDGVSAATLASDEDGNLYNGVIAISPLERISSPTTSNFEDEYARFLNALLAPRNLTANTAIGKFGYFTASCVDLLAYGFDKYLRERASANIMGLANGILC